MSLSGLKPSLLQIETLMGFSCLLMISRDGTADLVLSQLVQIEHFLFFR